MHRSVRCRALLLSRTYSQEASKQGRAIVFPRYGSPSEVLRPQTYPIPRPTAKTILIRFLASPINPADINQIEGSYPSKPKFDTSLGSDEPVAVGGNEGVAEVVETGSDVTELKVGDKVIMQDSKFGTWRTHALASPSQLLRVTDYGLSVLQAATISINPCTAYRMLIDFAHLEKGDWFVQNGANSGVGQAAIQIAKQWGFKSLNIVRDRPDIESLRSHLMKLGATQVITDTELGDRSLAKDKIPLWTNGKGIKLGLNCVGGKNATDMTRLLS